MKKTIKIALFNQKGGVGKTTATKSIAGELTKNFNKKVLVIDCDDSGNSGSGIAHTHTVTDGSLVQNEPEEYFAQIVIQNCEDGYVVDPSVAIVETNFPNLHLMPNRPKELQRANKVLMLSNFSSNYVFSDLLEPLDGEYDFILLDCAGSDGGNITMNCLIYADYVLVPFEADMDSINGYGRVVSKIKEAQRDNKSLKILGSFIAKGQLQTKMAKDIDAVAKEIVGEQYIPIIIRHSTEISKARMESTPLAYYKKTKPGFDYYCLTKVLLERLGENTSNYPLPERYENIQ